MTNNAKSRKEEALLYHSEGRPGKIEVIPTKPYSTQKDLSLAYSPGVAEPCLAIEHNPDDAYRYTAKGNLVAVISNGTAVLGLGDIGAAAGKPVMEGKGLLFKTFADIDVFDIEVDTKDTERFIETVKNISVTFGGINLEDIKAPECFEIEERLKEELSIPVMHDDQHGTAIISSAALLNALEVAGKKIGEVQVVVNGAGAAAVSCAKLYIALGVKPENLVMCDSKGVITTRRKNLTPVKAGFATDRGIETLEEALAGADVFLGLSVADVLTQEMVRSMAANPIVFALANPDPEISYDNAMAAREDIIFATGRSDYPNQVNNVLGFPYIFRGALDVRATKINEAMKIGAVLALAELAKQPVPDIVAAAYNDNDITFGRKYLIPKALDPRLISCISVAVAKAAIESGVARKTITDWKAYAQELESRMGRDDKLMRAVRSKVCTAAPRRIVFSEGDRLTTIKAAVHLANENIAEPILVGNRAKIETLLRDNHLHLDAKHIVDFQHDDEAERRNRYAALLYGKVSRKGVRMHEAVDYMMRRDWFTLMMVAAGDADTSILGYTHRYNEALKPVRQIFTQGDTTLATMEIVTTKKGPMFFADTAVNPSPSVDDLVHIALMAARTVRNFGIEPVIGMLSHSNFGTDTEPLASKIAKAVEILHYRYPELLVDGEMKADIALNKKARSEFYPFNKLGDRDINVLIFPNLSSANISYKMMEILGGAEINGPILMGLDRSCVHLIPEVAGTRAIRNLSVLAAAETISSK
ncbi:NADP-dependent malic enzyme [uncultured Alistipes sp.]|uniref:NADP-dependent malic enzyme n=1 Tax=uncultured Alistipes sp. TaxID=538949 RepID=UPI002637B5B6|nr:NADP-dependent malic enzyme [uncultured Alistipes sp.]